MLGTTLGAIGGLLDLGLWGVWYYRLRQVRIPEDRRPAFVAHTVALALGVASLVLGANAAGTVLAVVAIIGGGQFVILAAQSGQRPNEPAVAVGGPIIEFTLPDHTEQPFDIATLRGRPFLLKFFRGHW